jgi:hypothetical protein
LGLRLSSDLASKASYNIVRRESGYQYKALAALVLVLAIDDGVIQFDRVHLHQRDHARLIEFKLFHHNKFGHWRGRIFWILEQWMLVVSWLLVLKIQWAGLSGGDEALTPLVVKPLWRPFSLVVTVAVAGAYEWWCKRASASLWNGWKAMEKPIAHNTMYGTKSLLG